jgi:3-deoxy-D-manno-octulosonate 8-phosphate phosphatase (KDO 8-P phosphatase)
MSKSANRIKLVILDVDGTLTDGGIYILESGEQFKKFNAKDGLGVKLAVGRGLEVGIISHSTSHGMIAKRAQMLGIEKCYTGSAPKLEVLAGWCTELGIELTEVAFVGDDLNDLAIIGAVGLSACPADAMPEVREACDVVLGRNGGDGCVREFLDFHLDTPAPNSGEIDAAIRLQ